MCVDPFAPDRQFRQLFLYRWLLFQAGLAGVEQRGTDHLIRLFQGALHKGKGGIAMQGGPNKACGLGVAIKQNIFPRNQHIVEDDQRVDLVKAIGQRVISRIRARTPPGRACEPAPAQKLKPRRTQIADKADGIIRQFRIAPIGNRRLGKGLIGVSRCGFVFGAAHDDTGVGFLDHMQQHVGVLILRRFGPVAFWVRIGRHVKRIALQDFANVRFDILGKLRIDFVQNICAIKQGPHLAHGFVANSRNHACDVFENGISRPAFGPPIVLRPWQGVANRIDLAVLNNGHDVFGRRVVRHVINARPDVHQRFEHGMRGDILNTFAVDKNLAAVSDRVAILLPGSDHHKRSCKPVPRCPIIGSGKASSCADLI